LSESDNLIYSEEGEKDEDEEGKVTESMVAQSYSNAEIIRAKELAPFYFFCESIPTLKLFENFNNESDQDRSNDQNQNQDSNQNQNENTADKNRINRDSMQMKKLLAEFRSFVLRMSVPQNIEK